MSSSTLALIAPPLIDTITHYDQLGWNKSTVLRVSRNAFLIVFGLVGFVSGTFVSLSNIVDYFSGTTSPVGNTTTFGDPDPMLPSN